jgi:hypothetical protein
MHENNVSKQISLNVKKMFQALPSGTQDKAQVLVNQKYPFKKAINIGALNCKLKKK